MVFIALLLGIAAWEYARLFHAGGLLESLGVTLCIEPLARAETNFVNTVRQGLQMVDEINHPNFKVHLDVKAMSDDSIPIPELISSAAGKVGHFHANDPDGNGPYTGKVDFQEVATALAEIGYDEYVSVEVFDYSPGPEEIASKSLAYLREIFKQG